LYTLYVFDAEKTNKLKQSLPLGSLALIHIHRPLSAIHSAPNHPRQVRAKSAKSEPNPPFHLQRLPSLCRDMNRIPYHRETPYASSIHGAINPIYHTSVILLAFVSSGSERIRIRCIRRNKALRCDTIAGVPLLTATPLGITNTVGVVPRIVGVALTGFLLDSTHSWSVRRQSIFIIYIAFYESLWSP